MLILKWEVWLYSNIAHPVGNWCCFLFWPRACLGWVVAKLSVLLTPLGCSLQFVSILTAFPRKKQNQLCIVRCILLQPFCQCKTSEVKILASVEKGNLIPSLELSVLQTIANSYFQAVLMVCWCFLIAVHMESRADAWREGLELISALIKQSLFSSFGILCCHSWGAWEWCLQQ